MAYRYAVYFAPARGSPLDAFARAWLGRDAATGADIVRPDVAGIDIDELTRITAAPARYGFHATLKPPFRLADGRTGEELPEALSRFAAGHAPVVVPAMKLARLGSFLALVPAEACPALDRLAEGCVRAFDGFRAPMDDAERARRLATGLPAAEAANLKRWGYPYVMESFRFHMTLTGALEPDRLDAAFGALRPLVAAFDGAPLNVDRICLFAEPAPGAPFRRLGDFALTGVTVGPRA